MPDTLIATQGDENWVLSPDGAYVYVAGNDGYLTVFDAHSGESLYAVQLGSDLGAISLSPDGTRLAVVEEVPENVQQFQDWTSDSADVSFYVVDLNTFGADEFTYHVTGDSYTFADVAWSDNDTLQLSQNILPGWSGWAPIATVELATGTLTEHSSYYSGLGTSASLMTIPGSDTVLLGQLGLSSAEYFLIGPDGTSVADNGTYSNNVYGYAGGIEAASGTTASDRIVIVTGGGVHLYDGTMSYITNLASLYPDLGNAAGVTFSADGQRLFFLDSTNQSVVVVDAYNYSLVATVSLTGVVFDTLQWGEEIVVSPDGNGIYYNTSSGISYVSVDLPGTGTDAADDLSGTAGDDVINGRAGNDIIKGLAGDDWLIGGTGNDRLDGGDGFDVAAYETATAGVTVDLRVGDAQPTGGAGSDTLVRIEGLSGSVFNDTLSGNATDNLLMGYDGNDTLRGFAGNDDLYGENGDDQVLGGAGVDWLYGGSGADLLDGGTGADRLEGGDGNDIYILDDAGDLIVETATGGYDEMRVSGFNATIVAGVEALIITSGAVNAAGNFVANSLTGSNQDNVLSGLGGNDTLTGNGGNDTLDGGAGADQMKGGTGDDIYYVDNAGDSVVENAAEGTDIVNSSVSFALGANIENLTLTGTAIGGTGNALVNRIIGNASNNVIDGGAGADILRGGLGDDTYYVDNANDNPIENSASGTDSVFSSVNFAIGANIENLTVTGTAVRGSGNSLVNSITGNDVNNILDGGAGADVLRGGLGNDSYYVDNAGDSIVENSGEGRDRVYSSVTYTLGDNADDLFLRGSSAINATGNGLDNTLRGNSAANVLTGGAGADDLRGGTGGDTFVFSNGDFAGLTPSTSDRIIDFSHAEGDHINLAGVDANSASGGDQAFAFIGTGAFSHTAGELRYEITNGNTYLTGDTDGDGLADFMVRLDGSHALVGGDFVL